MNEVNKRSLKSLPKWVLFNGTFAYAFYAGVYLDIEWVRNGFVGICWLGVICSTLVFLAAMSGGRQDEGKKKANWYEFMDKIYDLIVVFFMFASGMPALAFGWAFSMLAVSIYQLPKEKKEDEIDE